MYNATTDQAQTFLSFRLAVAGTTASNMTKIDTALHDIQVEVDALETVTSIGALINSATAKTTPADNDMVGLMDSAASNILKKLSWANIKSTLKTYFDSYYLSGTGWLSLFGATYVSATSMTITDGALNGIVQKGTKLRWKQGGGYKYGVVATATGSPNLTVTIFPNTSYTIANSAITDLGYSNIENPAGWPEFFSFAPAVSSSAGAITTYVSVGKMRMNGRVCTIDLAIAISNNGTGSGFIRFALPVVAVFTCVGFGREDTVTGDQLQVIVYETTSTAEVFLYDGSYPGGTNHVLRLYLSYEY